MKNKATRPLIATALLSLSTTFSGCALLGSEQHRNEGIFENAAELTVRRAKLSVGMPEDEVFATLGIRNAGQLRRMTPRELNEEIYGGVQIQASFENKDTVEAYFNKLNGYWIEHSDVRRRKKYGATGSQLQSNGQTYLFPIVFEQGLLRKIGVDRGHAINEKTREGYLNDFGPDNLIPMVR